MFFCVSHEKKYVEFGKNCNIFHEVCGPVNYFKEKTVAERLCWEKTVLNYYVCFVLYYYIFSSFSSFLHFVDIFFLVFQFAYYWTPYEMCLI